MSNQPTTHRRYDWPGVRMVYVEGTVNDAGERNFPSTRELGDLFDIPYNRVRERCAREHWVDLRSAYQANLEKVRQERRIDALSKEAADLDRMALQHAKTGMRLVGARMAEIAQEVQERQKLRASIEATPDIYGPSLDAGEMNTLAAAVQRFYEIGQRALGEVPTVRTEITGPGGGPVRTDVRAELHADDPFRLFKFLQAAQNVGLVEGFDTIPLGQAQPLPAGDPDEAVDPSYP